MIAVRDGRAADAAALAAGFGAMGWRRPEERFRAYLRGALAGRLRFLVALRDGEVAGHVQRLPRARHGPSAARGLAEIADLNVLAPHRRRGVARALMDAAEVGGHACVGVGLTAEYAPAFALYLSRGHRPDGTGLAYCGTPLPHGATATVDDDLTLTLVRHHDEC